MSNPTDGAQIETQPTQRSCASSVQRPKTLLRTHATGKVLVLKKEQTPVHEAGEGSTRSPTVASSTTSSSSVTGVESLKGVSSTTVGDQANKRPAKVHVFDFLVSEKNDDEGEN